MTLSAGDPQATTGMAKAIYDAMDKELRAVLKKAGVPDDVIAQMAPSWRSLSFSIASGVVAELVVQPPSPPDYFWTWLAGFVQTLQSAPPGGIPAAVTEFVGRSPVPTSLKGIR
jgi:hypothetical protein